MSQRPTLARLRTLGAILIAPVAIAGSLTFGHDPSALRAAQPMIHRESDFVGAASCQSCHPDQHRTWDDTWHSSMTQRPTKQSVVGRFDGTRVEFFGQHAIPFEKDGEYFIDLPQNGKPRRTAKVAFTVGSHRYQQYFEKLDRGDGKAVYRRLPILWHMEGGEQRWLHLNGIFLDPDNPFWPEAGALWNENCIFCHTTGPEPRMANYDQQPDDARKQFDSHVADLGISCETCHGPGRKHVEAMRNPATRYAAHLGGDVEMHILNPETLDKERAVSACGQCHGQRVPRQVHAIRRYLEKGPTFRAGKLLDEHVLPIRRDTNFGGDPAAFAMRFWNDGTPRLSAYEYQGITDSPCYQRGPMTCGSCHTAHGGDPNNMVRPEMRTNHVCLQCHEEIAADVGAHTRHDPDGSGSKCVACHTPDIAYGVFGVRISHKIENPDPFRDAKFDRPNACTMCHLDKSLRWAGAEARRMFGTKYQVPDRRPDARLPAHTPDSVAAILGGDPVLRAVYAKALGRDDAAGEPALEPTLALLVTLGDSYASIRDLSKRSLRALDARTDWPLAEGLDAFDTLDGPPPPPDRTAAKRGAALRALLRSFVLNSKGRLPRPATPSIVTGDGQPDMRAITNALNQQSNKVISIGR